jgi:predicted RNA binding protein YcfA (HicA-like mRNA interferase family)
MKGVCLFIAATLWGCAENARECGPGTTEHNGECVVSGTGATGATCGSGTVEQNGVCVPTSTAPTCGSGTVEQNGVCVPVDPGPDCGPGTVAQNGACVPVDPGPDCGPGTVAQNGVCVPVDPGPDCGPGTVAQDGVCVPVDPGPDCGPGTVAQDGVCVPVAPGFLVRSTVTEVPANGFSKIPFFAIGTNDDGTPALDPIVFTVSPASAGSIVSANATLLPVGATVFFTPCSSSTAGCLGPFEVRIARQSDPSTILATTGPLQLVQPAGVGSPAPCLIGGNVLFLDGMNDFIFSGTETITHASWNASASPSHVSISLDPSDPSQGLFWFLDLDSSQLGQPLTETTYEDAQRWPFEGIGHPGLSLDGDGRGCNTLTGRFQIEELSVINGALKRVTATFEQHCEGGPGVVRGCVHIEN